MFKKLSCIAGAIVSTLFVVAHAKANDGMLNAREYLFPGQRLFAGPCNYDLVMQGDGNLVEYMLPGGQATWNAGTLNKGGYAAMQGDGNFVVYDWADKAVWSTHTDHHPGAFVYLDAAGSLFVLDPNWNQLWSVQGYGDFHNSCSYKTNMTFVTGNTDRPGGDYANVIPSQARYSWCGYFCSQDSNCKAYTYVPPGVQDASPHCWLKNTVPPTTPATGMVSGMIETH